MTTTETLGVTAPTPSTLPACASAQAPAGWPREDSDYLAAMVIPIFDQDGNVVAATLVDPDIYPAIARWRWQLNNGYAVRKRQLENGGRETIRLHRVVMCCITGDGLEIDHINRCRLDNRRSNLRYVTHVENMANADRPEWQGERRPKPRWHRSRRCWYAELKYRGKRHWVGSFADHDEAALALDEALRKMEARS